METTHELFQLEKQSLVHWKITDMPTSFIWIWIFFNGPLECGDGGIFKYWRGKQNLHQSVWAHEILYVDRSSKEK
jgi:hypothetical protein